MEVTFLDLFIELEDIESIYSYRLGREMASLPPFGRYLVLVPTHGVDIARKLRNLKYASIGSQLTRFFVTSPMKRRVKEGERSAVGSTGI